MITRRIQPTFILVASLFINFSVNAQAPAIEWQNTIGGTNHDEAKEIIQTTDGGLMVIGNSYSKNNGDKIETNMGGNSTFADIWIVKLNSSGDIVWQNTIGGTKDDHGRDIIQTADGGFLIGAESSSGISGDKTEAHYVGGSFGLDLWVIKIDSVGNIEWQNTIGGLEDDYMNAVYQDAGGNYIIASQSYSGLSGDKTVASYDDGTIEDIWLLKLNSSGAIVWQRNIGGDNYDYVDELKPVSQGGFILGASSSSNAGFDKTENTYGGSDVWIVKLDDNGFVEWDLNYGGSENDYTAGIELTDDGGFVEGAYSYSGISGNKTVNTVGSADYWVLKLDATGNILWQNDFGGSGIDWMMDLSIMEDGSIVYAGWSYSGISGNKSEPASGLFDIWLCATDDAGNLIWENTIGGSLEDYVSAVSECFDGSFILSASSNSEISGDKSEPQWGNTNAKDYWIIKFFPAVCAVPDNLFADNIMTTKATIHWDAIVGADLYQIWYRPSSGGIWTKKSSSVNYKTINMLTPDTEFEYKVRTKCGDGDLGEFSPIENFTTLPLRNTAGNDESIDIVLYPNPAADKLTVVITGLTIYDSRLTITDLSGQVTDQFIITEFKFELDISDYPAGIYFIKIDGQEQIEKFIKSE